MRSTYGSITASSVDSPGGRESLLERRTPMAINVMTHVWSLDLQPHLKYVAIALADHAHADGGEARPSQAFLAEKTGLSDRQIRRTLADLVEAGVIQIQRPAGRNRATTYRFVLADTHVLPSGENGRTRSTNGRTPASSLADTHVRLTVKTVIRNKSESTVVDEPALSHEDHLARIREARKQIGSRSRRQ
jgi:hypothetical protein